MTPTEMQKIQAEKEKTRRFIILVSSLSLAGVGLLSAVVFYALRIGSDEPTPLPGPVGLATSAWTPTGAPAPTSTPSPLSTPLATAAPAPRVPTQTTPVWTVTPRVAGPAPATPPKPTPTPVAGLLPAASVPANALVHFDLPAAEPTTTDYKNFDVTSRGRDADTPTLRRYNFDDTVAGQFWTSAWGSNDIKWPAGGMQVSVDAASTLWGPGHVARQGKASAREIIVSVANADDQNQGFLNHGVFTWRKEQFLKGGDVKPVAFDGTTGSLLSLHVKRFSNEAAGSVIRFAIKEGRQYYLSEANLTKPGTFTVDRFGGSNDPGQRWAPWNPTATDFSVPDSASLTFGPVTFKDVQAVGFAYHGGRAKYLGGIQFDQFTVCGKVPGSPTPIPTSQPEGSASPTPAGEPRAPLTPLPTPHGNRSPTPKR